MSRFRVPAAAGLAAAAVLLTPTVAYAATLDDLKPRLTYGYYSGSARHLQEPANAELNGVLDDASGRVVVAGYRTTSVWLRLNGIDTSVAGREFGAHLHVGPCVEDEPGTALGHYNIHDFVTLETPREVNEETEVWLDFVVGADGTASAKAIVPWTPDVGSRAIVIHEMHTDHVTGGAGNRLACLPIRIQQS
jgi:Cu/Zn superoxide dismutase